MISGRENYKRAIEFKAPEYLPARIGCNFNWLYEKDKDKVAKIKELQGCFPDDILNWLGMWKKTDMPVMPNGVRRWVDEWGTTWMDDGLGGRTEICPLEDGYHLLDSYKFPDPYLPGRFDIDDEKLKNRGDRYVRARVWFTLFERLWILRGFNNMLMDPYIETDNFERLRDRIVEINLIMIDQWLERKVDGIFFSDDWGTQKDLLIEPDDWRKFYKPAYKIMFRRVRDGGAHVWMHLCGNIASILPDLVEIGLSVLNPIQTQAMDIRKLSQEFGGKICFNGGADVQDTLIYGTPDEVKREVHELVKLFGRFDGGYIGGTSQTIMPETPLDNVIALYEAFVEYQ